ncbi:MAG TPA: molybdopterin-dependent oxidoreductase, partial [Myxococcota bacterium]|nr:molybdopterin-dependent oxidoreductase [Myxococcota bacterium]
PRPGTFDPAEALADSARRVNPHHDNLLSRTRLTRGDVERALAGSAQVVRRRFTTQRIEHAFLEPESCLVVPRRDEGSGEPSYRVWSQGQGIFDDQQSIAKVLGVPPDRVHVTLVPPGGAFGGKEDLSVQAHAALLARATGRPVKVTLSRHDSVRMHPKRHPFVMDYEVGCDADGRLTAVRARILGDSGAYASVGGKVLERAAGHACGPYRVDHIDIESRAAYTNNPPSGAMRGFGVCQTSFAIEGCLDELAQKLGLDPLEMRFRNALKVGDVYATGQVLEKSVGLVETLLAIKPHYEDAKRRGVAVGVACGLKNSGLGNGGVESGRARLEVVHEVHDDVNEMNDASQRSQGPVVLAYAGFTEMGQGLMTVLTQIVCEETGLPADRVRVLIDTTHPLGSGQTTGSRGTLLAGRAMRAAAQKLGAALSAV